MKHSILKNTAHVFARVPEKAEPLLLQNILILLLFFYICSAADILSHDGVYWLIVYLMRALTGTEEPNVPVFILLYLRVFSIMIPLLYCRLMERRSMRSMGFTRQHAVPDYLIGFSVGAVMFSASLGLAMLGGGVTFAGVGNISAGLLVTVIPAWMIQGFSEELSYRGYLMMSTGAYHKPLTALAVSAVAFAAGHLMNPGMSVLAFVNLVLYGVFAGLYFLRTDSIWGVAAMHSAWNFMQGNFYGLDVSGMDTSGTVLQMSAHSDMNWLTGGEFGLEGGVAVTAVMVAACVVVMLVPQRRVASAGDSIR